VFSILIEVNVNAESIEEAKDIASYIHEVLNYNGTTNSVNVTNEISH